MEHKRGFFLNNILVGLFNVIKVKEACEAPKKTQIK